jgi:acetyl esterase
MTQARASGGSWLGAISDVESELRITSLEQLVRQRDDPARDLRRHNVDLPELARDERVVLREHEGRVLEAEVYVPHGDGPFPPVLYMHGGGWAWDSAETVRKLTMTLAARGYCVVNLDYALAPEFPFPSAVEDVVYAARWMTRHIEDFGGSGGGIAIGGASAGANLSAAAIVALTSGEELVESGDLEGVEVSFSAAMLLWGIFDFPLMTVEPGGFAGIVDVMFNRSYLGPNSLFLHRNPLVSPIYAEHLDLFPPTYLVAGDRDPALPQSLAMTRALANAGVPTTLAVPAGLNHAFAFNAFKDDPRPTREMERLFAWLDESSRPGAGPAALH